MMPIHRSAPLAGLALLAIPMLAHAVDPVDYGDFLQVEGVIPLPASTGDDLDALGTIQFVTVSDPSDGLGFRILDAADPAAPVALGGLPLAATAVRVVDASGPCVAVAEGGTVHFVDASDPTDPTVVASIAIPGGIAEMESDGSGTSLVCRDGSGMIHVVAPVVGCGASASVSSAALPSGVPAAFVVQGDLAYLGYGAPPRLAIVDLTSIGTGSVSEVGVEEGFFIPTDVAVDGDRVAMATLNNGLDVFDVSTPSNPVHLGSSGGFSGLLVELSDTHVFGYDGAGFWIYERSTFDLREARFETPFGYLPSLARTRFDLEKEDLLRRGGGDPTVLYAIGFTDGEADIVVIDVTNPLSVPTLDQADIPWAMNVARYGDLIAVTGQSSVEFFTTEDDPFAFLPVSQQPVFFPGDIAAADSMFYVIDGTAQVQVIDPGPPASIVNTISPGVGPIGVTNFGSGVMTWGSVAGVQPILPDHSVGGIYQPGPFVVDVITEGTTAWVSTLDHDIHEVDYSDPLNPSLIQVHALDIRTGRLYRPIGRNWLATYSVDGPVMKVVDLETEQQVDVGLAGFADALSGFAVSGQDASRRVGAEDVIHVLGQGSMIAVDVSTFDEPWVAGAYSAPGLDTASAVKVGGAIVLADQTGGAAMGRLLAAPAHGGSILSAPFVGGAPGPRWLGAPRPMPFTAGTAVPVELETRTRVRAEVFDPTGRRVRALDASSLPAGRHLIRWDGRTDAGLDAPAGVYFVEVEAAGRREARRVVRVAR